MNGPSFTEILRAMEKIQGRREFRRVTLRINKRECNGLAQLANGRPLSYALENILNEYLIVLDKMAEEEKSIKKGSFSISEDLAKKLAVMARRRKTTISKLMHDVLKLAYPVRPEKRRDTRSDDEDLY